MPTDEFLSKVNRPSRYLGGELGSIRKNPEQVDVSFALAFPDVYEVGMSHLGFAILYHILNGLDWAAAERVFAPWPDMEAHLRGAGAPLASLESDRPLRRFDIVGFTLQYELSYTNVLNMLDLAGDSLAADRRAAPAIRWWSSAAPAPSTRNRWPILSTAALIGDGEEAMVEFWPRCGRRKPPARSRTALLERLAQIDGVYVPAFFAVDYHARWPPCRHPSVAPSYEQVRRRFWPIWKRRPFPASPIVPFMNTVHDRVAVEIARGCTRGCRFCQAGYIYRPVRERSPQKIKQI